MKTYAILVIPLLILAGAGCSTPASTSPPPSASAPAYFTPAQQEGPYYPVEKPDDRDSDLVHVSGADGLPDGDILFLSGVVYDSAGQPVDGASIEIWQTDSRGAYMHPADPATEQRDRNFQFYGESTTGADGVYSFQTILPGLYGSRPRHIHFKVIYNGDTVLTSQFYFADEVQFSGEERHLLIETVPAEDDEGRPILVGERDIVLRLEA